jgi:hypothetical protein
VIVTVGFVALDVWWQIVIFLGSGQFCACPKTTTARKSDARKIERVTWVLAGLIAIPP